MYTKFIIFSHCTVESDSSFLDSDRREEQMVRLNNDVVPKLISHMGPFSFPPNTSHPHKGMGTMRSITQIQSRQLEMPSRGNERQPYTL